MYLVFIPAMYPQGGCDTPSSFAGLTKQEPKEGEPVRFEPLSGSIQLHCQDMKMKSSSSNNPSLSSRGVVDRLCPLSDNVIIVETSAGERYLFEPIK